STNIENSYRKMYSNSNSIHAQNSGKNLDDTFFFQKEINCSPENCQLPYGTCIDTRTCQCQKGYANYIPNTFSENQTTPTQYCAYQQKKQIFALIGELFVLGNI